MAYYLDLFSPATYQAFGRSDQTVSGFRVRQKQAASRIKSGDQLLCYMTQLSRWFGILDVLGPWFEDSTPLFLPEDDPFVVRFNVRPVAWLEPEKALPIHAPELWEALSFTKGHSKSTSTWTGKLRASLVQLSKADGQLIERLILQQQSAMGQVYELSDADRRKLVTHQVRRLDKVVSVSVPEDSEPAPTLTPPRPETRESIRIQSLLARIGAEMGLKVWLPKADRGGVFEEWSVPDRPVLDMLPLNYDETTLKTIEQIDVIWLKGRSIVRAFEVEHTTSIYSGLLRMADLLALQPNMDIKLHIVAPAERRDKVFQEVQRPVFSLLEKGPLSESCTYLSYESVRELSDLKHLSHLSDTVVDEYAEPAE